MLKFEIKYACLLLFVIITACNRPEKTSKEKNLKILEISKKMVGEENYDSIYQQALDSLNTWCAVKLSAYQSIWSFNYRLDSVICFNREKDRMVTTILVRCHRRECETDDVHYFYGAKIKGRWYFFQGGGTMVVLREHYQKNIHTPVSFEKLHELAVDQMLRGYIKKKAGLWEINDAFFTHHFENVGWGDFNSQTRKDTVTYGQRFTNKRAYFESIYQYVSTGKWPSKEEVGTEAFQ